MAFKFVTNFKYFYGSRAIFVYNLLGKKFKNETDWRFMNYGYSFKNENDVPALLVEDEQERYSAFLYHAVGSQIDLTGKNLLDIGSGRGGGSSFVHRYHKTKKTIGMDLAESAVAFCQKVYRNIDGLTFQVGDAMNLPFDDAEFDAVLNVESSHCYPDTKAFLNGVYRVLKPGGSFLYTDFHFKGDRADTSLREAGFDLVEPTDVTKNVIQGMELDSGRRRALIKSRLPVFLHRMASLWAGTSDSWMYNDFKDGSREYTIYLATRPA